jgi:hypothetical protein
MCQPVDYSDSHDAIGIAKVAHYYFLTKVLDLLDTVFFVLKKKNSHVSFLHVYHHAGMVALTWIGTKYFPGGHSVFTGLINSIVHVIMYFYYFLTTVDNKYKQSFWKKYITQLQMVIHSLSLLLLKKIYLDSVWLDGTSLVVAANYSRLWIPEIRIAFHAAAKRLHFHSVFRLLSKSIWNDKEY